MLDLSGLSTISNTGVLVSQVRVLASDGGFVDLSGLTRFEHPFQSGFSFQQGTSSIVAEGEGSRIDASSLTEVVGEAGLNIEYAARDGGEIDAPLVSVLIGVALNLNEAASFDSLVNGTRLAVSATGSEASVSFPLLTTLQDGNLSLSDGATVSVPLLSNIAGTNISVSGGVTLALPSVDENVVATSVSSLSATGVGSVLDLSGLSTISNTGVLVSQVRVLASDGGFVDLSGLTRFEHPFQSGLSFQQGTSSIVAEGAGSRIDASSLTEVVGEAGLNIEYALRDGGEIDAPLVSDLIGVALNLSEATSFDFGGTLSLTNAEVVLAQDAELNVVQLNIDPSSLVSGGGVINGDVDNSGIVQLDSNTLQITGSFAQSDVGQLLVGISDLSSDNVFGRLVIDGAATLDGLLVLAAAEDSVTETTITPVTFQSVLGEFAEVQADNLLAFEIETEFLAEGVELQFVRV